MSRFTKTLTAAALLTGVAAAPGLAQTNPPRTGDRPPAAAGGAPAALTDAEFATRVAMSDLFEIESSRLAAQQAQDPEVKAFAQKMIDDHTKSSERLKGILGQSGAPAQVPTQLDAPHQEKLARLKATRGKSFDAAYMEMQNEGHETAVALFTAYSKSGTNGALKAFATEVLPIIEMHYQQAQKLARSTG